MGTSGLDKKERGEVKKKRKKSGTRKVSNWLSFLFGCGEEEETEKKKDKINSEERISRKVGRVAAFWFPAPCF